MASRFDSFGDLLKAPLSPTLIRANKFVELFAENVVFEFPYASDGFADRLPGRDQLAVQLARLAPLLKFDGFELEATHAYASVVTLREGRIARYKDYWNPLVTLAAIGGDGSVATLGGGRASHV